MPDIYSVADQFRSALLRNERGAATELVKAYAEVWRTLQKRVAALTEQIGQARARGETVNRAWLLQSNRLESLRFQVERELRKFISLAHPLITQQQREAVTSAQSQTEELLLFNYQKAPPEATAAIAATFNRLPASAVQSIVGFAGNGSPLGELLDALAPDGGERVKNALIEAVALGRSPKQTARAIQDSLGGNLSKALTIARTETIRAYREASHQTYKNNEDILNGWIWTARLGGTTCPLCIAMHGTEHGPDERLESHPNCRCVMVPQTKTWAELGFPEITETRAQVEKGSDWFARQDAATQQQVLGPDGSAALTAGRVNLNDFVGRKRKSEWGRPYYARSLKDALKAQPAAPQPKLSEKELLKIIRQQEDLIRTQKKETAFFYDEHGNVLLRKQGTKDRIEFKRSELDGLRGSAATHNHPSGLNYAESDPRRAGNSFSLRDLRSACGTGLKLIRAVTPTRRFEMRPPKAGWDLEYFTKSLEPAFQRHFNQVAKELKHQVENGETSAKQAAVTLLHETWTRVAQELGLQYRVEND